MKDSAFGKTEILNFAILLKGSRKIAITCHLSPDGDALGSSLGLKCVLSNLNRNAKVSVITPDEPTRSLSFLPFFNTIIPYSRCNQKAIDILEEADIIVCLDFNSLHRTDLLAHFIEKSPAKKILIDHHLHPEDFADITFSYPDRPATCMLLFEILSYANLGEYIDSKAANCLLTGMMTDTGDFTYNLTDSNIYYVIAKLVEKGADKVKLTRLLFNTFRESNLRIQGFALAEKMEVFPNEHASLIVLSRDELNRFGYQRGDTEGLVNKPLSIPGILYSCYLREEDGYIKVSMRSLGDLPVNEICSDYFGGGGHRNAAGGEYYGTMQQCVNQFKSLLEINKRKYITNNPVLQSLLKEENGI